MYTCIANATPLPPLPPASHLNSLSSSCGGICFQRLHLSLFILPFRTFGTMWIQASFLTVLSLFAHSIFAQTRQCYLPDGSKAGSQYQPCRSAVDTSSMCCDTGGGDQCLPNGLCNGWPNNTQLWRDSCTDSSWRSPFCLQLCVNGVGSIKAGWACCFPPDAKAC